MTTYQPCECCGKTDLPTGHELCGMVSLCLPCYTSLMYMTETEEHLRRHPNRDEVGVMSDVA